MKTLLSTILGCLMIISTNAQVGVNNPSPEQALDVNGKLKITDDSNTPTAGTIRYNASSNDYEGHNGSQWKSFTMNKGGLPNGAIPCYSRLNISTDGTFTTFSIREMANNNNPFTAVPAGKYFIVTAASFTGPASGATVNTNYTIRIAGSFDVNNEVIWLQGRHENGPLSTFINGTAPLIILRGGESLRAQHPNFADDNTSVNVFVRGWLVDDLNY